MNNICFKLCCVFTIAIVSLFHGCSSGTDSIVDFKPGSKEESSYLDEESDPSIEESVIESKPESSTPESKPESSRTESKPEESKSSHTHSYSPTVTAATCTSGGYTTYKCSCGDSYTADRTEALGHNWSSYSTVTSATCTSAGSEKRTCSRCGAVDTRTTSATGHNWSSWTTTKDPTETSEGSKERKCNNKNCGKVETASIAKLAHTHSYTIPETVVVTPAWDETITVIDTEAWDESVLVSDAWDEQVLVSEAWDEDQGYQIKGIRCYCGIFFEDTIPWRNHQESILSQYEKYSDAWNKAEYDHNGYYSDYEWVSNWVHHDAVYKWVHHDAEYKTVHHDAVTHTETIHHDAVTTTVYKCSCGAYQ